MIHPRWYVRPCLLLDAIAFLLRRGFGNRLWRFPCYWRNATFHPFYRTLLSVPTSCYSVKESSSDYQWNSNEQSFIPFQNGADNEEVDLLGNRLVKSSERLAETQREPDESVVWRSKDWWRATACVNKANFLDVHVCRWYSERPGWRQEPLDLWSETVAVGTQIMANKMAVNASITFQGIRQSGRSSGWSARQLEEWMNAHNEWMNKRNFENCNFKFEPDVH
jgi:hypothetical protein